MVQNFLKCSLLLIITSVFLVQYVNSAEAINSNIKGNDISKNKSSVATVCEHKLVDGTPYKGPCISQTPVKTSLVKEEQHISVTDSEVADLLHHVTSEKPSQIRSSQKTSLNKTSPGLESESSIDKIVVPETKLNNNSRFNISTGGIAALTCLTIAVVFYFGVMIWKRMVMNSYQNREILLNDDDIGDINDEDMRHFEAACIQIEA